MRRRSRTRRALKWVGVAVCLLIVLVAGATAGRYAGCNSGQNYAIQCGFGAVRFYWKVQDIPGFTPKTAMQPRRWVRPVGDWAGIRDRCKIEGRWPSRGFQWGMRWITVPLWMLLIAVGIPTGILWWYDWRHRFPPGHCRRCGYNLTANVSGVCPECGTAIKREGKAT